MLGQLPHPNEAFRQISSRSLEQVGLHDRVFGLFIRRTRVSHRVSQLGDKMLVQQNIGTVGKQVKKAFELWDEEVAMETLWPNNLAVISVSPARWRGGGEVVTEDPQHKTASDKWVGPWKPTHSTKWE